MQEMYQSFINVDNIFWGDDVYRWWFYLAIVLILLFEKKKSTRITFAWYSIVFLVGLFSPLCNWIMSFIHSAWQYRARLYSMLPIPYVLALGAILLIDKVCCIHKRELTDNQCEKQKWIPIIKLNMVMSICVIIILGGTDVYQQDWMKPAQNLEKVPAAVMELDAIWKTGKDVTIAVPDSLSSYIRQVSPSFYMPYGRILNSLGAMLSQENPNPTDVMIQAGEQSCEYIVVYDNEINEINFRNNGYEPCERLTGYLVYEVRNVASIRKEYDEKRQVVKLYYLDVNGNPQINSQGYSGFAYEYDRVGNCIKEIYLNADGSRCTLSQGYAAVAKTYTDISHQINSLRYLDTDDQPILIGGRYETRYRYNKDRRIEYESYYDQNGQPMIRTDLLYASKKISYDGLGHILREDFFDTDGNSTIIVSGYASYSQEFDQNGKVVKETYYGIDGQPIRNRAGYAGVSRSFSNNGVKTCETYLDENGKATKKTTGYAQVRWEYNEANQIISESYWDENESPIVSFAGYHEFTREYDMDGNIIEERYYDVDGSLTMCKEGYAIVSRTWNEQKQLLTERYYSKDGIITNNIYGYAFLERIYNGLDLIEEKKYDAEDNQVE